MPAPPEHPPESFESHLPPAVPPATGEEPRVLAAAPRINRLADEFELNPLGRYHDQEEREAALASAGEPERVREAVRRVIQEGRFIGEVAREMGLAPSSIYRWEKRYLDFLSEQDGINRPEDWQDVYTWTGAPEIPAAWKVKFVENWDILLDATHARAADFKQDPLEIFLHNSMITGWLFRDGRLDRNVALGAAVGIILVIVLASFLRAKAGQTVTATPAAPLHDTETLDREQIELARPVALDFLHAKGWEKKAAFVRDEVRVRPIMAAWYQNHFSGGFDDAELVFAIRNGDMVDFVATCEKSNPEPAFLALFKEDGTYKVDWETSSGYQHESWAEMVAQRPKNPILLRCLIERGDYYNYDFADEEKWYCFKMTYPAGPVKLYGYVERHTQLGARLDALLEFNTFAGVVVEGVYPPGGRSGNQLRLLSLIHEGWIPEPASADTSNK